VNKISFLYCRHEECITLICLDTFQLMPSSLYTSECQFFVIFFVTLQTHKAATSTLLLIFGHTAEVLIFVFFFYRKYGLSGLWSSGL
jgi:hypothetical protein